MNPHLRIVIIFVLFLFNVWFTGLMGYFVFHYFNLELTDEAFTWGLIMLPTAIVPTLLFWIAFGIVIDEHIKMNKLEKFKKF